MDTVNEWEARGRRLTVGADEIFLIDTGGTGEPLLVIHGFPSSSFDYRHVLGAFTDAGLRVVLLDLPGYGLSDKPDRPYSLMAAADAVEAVCAATGIERCTLLTHDVGDSVGGEILARSIDGSLKFEITSRVICNGSIYMELVQLSPGQELMLSLPDAMLTPEQTPGPELFKMSLGATFAVPATDEELEAQWELASRAEGHRLIPRVIRYIEERYVQERRWTGAIERHVSPLSIVWGDADPIAVVAMAHRLADARPDASLELLGGIGHYPMIEAPAAFAAAVLAGVGTTSA